MATFLARRYMRKLEQVSHTERIVGIVIILLLAGILAAFATQVATNRDYLFELDVAIDVEPRRTENPFPHPGVPDWRAPANVSRFTPDTLYQKINGRADAYLQFHVVGLTFGSYSHETDSRQRLDVYWYDMGEPVNALGIYRAEAPPEATAVSIGAEGYQVGGAVFFRKGSSYVQVMAGGPGEADADAALEIARRVAERIDDTDSNSSARELLGKYKAFVEQYGRVLPKSAEAADPLVTGEISGLIDVAFAKGRYVGGVIGAEKAAVATEACQAFREGLTVR